MILLSLILAVLLETGMSMSIPTDKRLQPGNPVNRHFVTLATSGSSTTQTGFKSNLTLPSANNVLGNPSLPGWTTSGGLNWLGFDITEFNSSLILSYNLAVGGATTESTLIPPYAPTVKSFVDQVDDFMANLHRSPPLWSSKNLLVGIWIANNDVGESWNKANLSELYENVSGKYFEQLQRLYEEGARNFVVLNCAPQYTTPLMRGNGSDLKKLASAVNLYNSIMAKNLARFKKRNCGVQAWLVDTAVAYYEALDHPEKYGAPDDICENEDGVSCLWWNNYHPGIAIHRLLGAEVARIVGAPWFK